MEAQQPAQILREADGSRPTGAPEDQDLVAAVLKKYDVDEQSVPPMAVAFLMTVIPPVLFMENQRDSTAGHPEIIGLAERYLREVEGEPIPR